MKTIINKICALSLLSLVFFACEKDEERIVVQAGTAPVLTASESTLVLVKDNEAEDAITFSWSASDFGYPAAVSYFLEVDEAGNNFANAVSADLGSGSSSTFTVQQFNSLLNQLEASPGTAGNFEIRVRAQVSPNVPAVFSNALPLNATPYLDVDFATLYMVGNATQNGWDNAPGRVTPMFPSETAADTYTYTGFFNEGMLKFVQFPGQWAPQWGQSGPGVLAYRPTESVADPAPLDIPAAGYYTITIDVANLTYTLVPFAESAAASYSSIGIIGVFNDWATIVPMEKNTFSPHIWTLNHTFGSDTKMKFRIAQDWSVNWGPSSNVDRLYGKGVDGGQDMEVKAGSYTIIFNDLTGHYMLIPR
jgi:starch-binding outer membrane protein SusE/F